jgi:hypothetical protein
MKRIKRFGVLQTSKVVAINLFFIALIFMVPFALMSRSLMASKVMGFQFGGGLFFFLLPVLYAVMGFIGTALTCVIYNYIAGWTGGIEVEFEVSDEEITDEEMSSVE